MTEEEIFHEALARPPADRGAYLDAACAGDPALRAGVAALLRANVGATEFLAGPAPTATVDHGPESEGPGTAVGPYKLLEQLGEGGFGVVFLAEQSAPVRRKVALKLLKPGMDTRQVVARFEAERQALALMDHPNIARVYDGGSTAAGRPYFVMELVKGVPITEFCDQHQVPPRRRLELFVSVCAAVQHAHQKGIIHRDLKPSNILVSRHDTTPVVKVIDFGVAKALGQELTDKTLFTGVAQMVGTPLYMSPEQAGMSDLDVDTRSDVYSLGVLLYELLTGTTPFDRERLKAAGYDEIRRIIREEEAPRPSTRVSTLGLVATTVSANRGTEPRKLSALVRGELDWVVMKALEKDRTRRYDTAAGFAADVERYLADEPVLACPPSAGYRLRKFARRHRGPVLAAAVVAAALVVGMAGTTWGMVRATTAEAEAVSEAQQKKDALADKDAALVEAREQLFGGLRHQSRAERVSGGVGQRFETLAAVRRAAAIRVTPELRADATAALVLADLELAREWDGCPDGTVGVGFAAALDRYVRLDRQGGLTVCKLTDAGEEVVARLPAHGEPGFNGPHVSPDGRFAAYKHGVAGGSSHAVRVWKLDGPAPAVLFDEPAGQHEGALAFHPDGKQLAIGHPDGWVSVYDLTTGRRVHRRSLGELPTWLDFNSRDHRLAVTAGPSVRIFDTDTGRELAALRNPTAARPFSVTWHPDGRRLAVTGSDNKIHLWGADAAEVIASWAGGGEGVQLRFNHAGDRLLSYNWDGRAVLWEAATGRQLMSFRSGLRAQFSPDDRLFAHSVSGSKLQLWRAAFGREYRTLRRHRAGPRDVVINVAVHPDGRTAAVGDLGGLAFFDVATGEELASVRHGRHAEDQPVWFAGPGGEGAGGWVTGGRGGLSLWPTRVDPARPDILRVGPPRPIAAGLRSAFAQAASASADGRVVAVPLGHSVALIHRDRPDRRLTLGPQYDVRFAAVSPDGKWVVTGSHWRDGRSKSARVWDGETGRPVRDLPVEGSTPVRFSPDGRWLVTSTDGVDSRLWETGTWREVRRFEGTLPAFSPDGRLMAVGDVLGVVRLIETETGREVARVSSPEPVWYNVAAFTADGTRLLGVTSGGTGVWDLRAIRAQLKELGLDWEWPEFPPAAPAQRIEIIADDLGEDARSPAAKARRKITRYATDHAAAPDSPLHCNNLAWAYLVAPEPVRDVAAALPLAEKADKLRPGTTTYRNTLGLAYYRAGRYADAVRTLRPNLDGQDDAGLAFDLYVLAMSHHQLSEPGPARAYYDWAVRWERTQRDLHADEVEELAAFRAETETLLGISPKKD